VQMRTDRHSYGFLTNVGMQGTHDFALAGLVFRLFLEEANAPHATIDCFESVSGWCLDRHWHILHIMVANTRGRSLRFLRPHSGASVALGDLMCRVYVPFILALIAAGVNG